MWLSVDEFYKGLWRSIREVHCSVRRYWIKHLLSCKKMAYLIAFSVCEWILLGATRKCRSFLDSRSSQTELWCHIYASSTTILEHNQNRMKNSRLDRIIRSCGPVMIVHHLLLYLLWRTIYLCFFSMFFPDHQFFPTFQPQIQLIRITFAIWCVHLEMCQFFSLLTNWLIRPNKHIGTVRQFIASSSVLFCPVLPHALHTQHSHIHEFNTVQQKCSHRSF